MNVHAKNPAAAGRRMTPLFSSRPIDAAFEGHQCGDGITPVYSQAGSSGNVDEYASGISEFDF